MRQIRVLLVDDHRILRAGLMALLSKEPDLVIVGEAADGVEAVQLSRQLQPQVVVMDVRLPHLSGADATRAIRRASPQTQILVLSMHDSPSLVLGMLRAGACSYLLKESAGAELAEAIRSTSQGQPVFTPEIARTVVHCLSDLPRGGEEELTPREREIFELVAQGKTSREIARQLSLSTKTVDNCRTTILQKLHARNRVEAIAVGLQRGLLTLPSTIG